GQAKVRVDLAMGGLFGAENRDKNARVFQHVTQALSLSACVRMLGNIKDQEWRNTFILGHMGNRGEVTMLCGIVAELLTVTKLRLRQAMHSTAGLARLNDGRNVISVPIDGYAAFYDGQGQTLGLQIAIIDADQRSELGAVRMAHDEKTVGIAPVLGDMVM